MTTNDLNHLDWQAFCYVANELSLAEREAFEDALAVDQVAREALARAVELSCVVAVAECHEAPTVRVVPVQAASRSSNRWALRAAWMSLGAAASLLIAVLVSTQKGREPATADSRPDASEVNRELASAWTQSRADLPSVWQSEAASLEASLEGITLDSAVSGPYLNPADDEAVALAASEAPSWMTAALLAQAGDIAGESPEVMEN